MPGEAGRPAGPSDAAKRASDAVTLALLADKEGNAGRWMALRLSDGGSDGVVYDHPHEAARAQLHYQLCAYIRIPRGGMPPREAEAILNYHRRVYDAGNRPPYLDGFVVIMPNSPEVARHDNTIRYGRPGPPG